MVLRYHQVPHPMMWFLAKTGLRYHIILILLYNLPFWETYPQATHAEMAGIGRAMRRQGKIFSVLNARRGSVKSAVVLCGISNLSPSIAIGWR